MGAPAGRDRWLQRAQHLLRRTQRSTAAPNIFFAPPTNPSMREHSSEFARVLTALALVALVAIGAGCGSSPGAPGGGYGSGNGGAVSVTGLPPGTMTSVPMFPG